MRLLEAETRLEVEGGPVDNVEDDEDDGEGDEHGHVHLASLVLLHRRRDLPERVDLHLKSKRKNVIVRVRLFKNWSAQRSGCLKIFRCILG